MPPRAKPLPSTAQSTVMLSRVARSLYWMSRYIERAENMARLLDVNLQFLLDFQGVTDASVTQHWGPILISSGCEELFQQHYDEADSRNVTKFLTFDQNNPNSILSCISAARENARMIRDQISSDMWETINDLHLFVRNQSTRKNWDEADLYSRVKASAHLFEGLTASTYSRGEGWEFIEFGKYLERADKTTRILDVKYHILLPDVSDVGGAVDTAQWQAVLRSASALEAYRRFYVREILPWKVAEFLIFSESFPRSLLFCVAKVDDTLGRILHENRSRPRAEAARVARGLFDELQATDIAAVLKGGLHEFLIAKQKSLDQIGEEVLQTTLFSADDFGPEEHQQQQTQQ